MSKQLDPGALVADIAAVFERHKVPEQLRLGILIGISAGALKDQGHSDELVKQIIAKAVNAAMASGR
jgi:uncharacterized protein YejL (UPF0352 family)